MSNETGRTIYEEYFSFFIQFMKSENDKVKLNSQYMYGGRTFKEINIGDDKSLYSFVDLFTSDGLDAVTRAPKMQMINGVEVVAPRYDEPTGNHENICCFNPSLQDGHSLEQWGFLTGNQKHAALRFGYHSNVKDAKAYADAHREKV